MNRFARVPLAAIGLLVIALSCRLVLAAPHGVDALIVTPPAQAHQFDFLIGEWSLIARPKLGALARMVHGDLHLTGTWRARTGLDGWGIVDEMQLIDASGNPAALLAVTRFYDVRAKRWSISSFDVYRGVHSLSTATASVDGKSMRGETRAPSPDAPASLVRSVIESVDRDHFVLRQDRSEDGGQSWDENVLVVEATRVADPSGR